MRHVYLAATGQNRGKTTVSLGVLDGFQRRGLSTAFLKPVGQRTIIEDGVPADEDAILMKQVFGLPEPLRQMSPVHIPRGFTQAYIEGQVVEDLPARIRTAHAAFAERRHPAHRGDRPRRGRGGHRAVERGRRVDARDAGRHRVGGRRRAPDRRDRPQRGAVRAAGRQGRRRDRQQGRPGRQARPRPDPRARPGAPRHPAPGRPAVPADPVQPDAGHGPGGPPWPDHPCRPGPRRGHRRDRHRGDGAGAHARADRAAQPGHRAGRPDRRDRRDRGRAGTTARTAARARSASS